MNTLPLPSGLVGALIALVTAAVTCLTLWCGRRLTARRVPSTVTAASSIGSTRRRWSQTRSRPEQELLSRSRALEAIARLTEANSTVEHAIADIGEHPDVPVELRSIVDRRRRGRTLEEAVDDVSRDLQGATTVLAALSTVASVRGRISATLDDAAAMLRDDASLIAERRVHSAQARASGVVLSLLPLAFAAWSVGTDSNVRTFLIASPAGWACVAVGLALNVGGWRWMRRITNGTPR
jgi:tight adherence protein B